ncbi:hypothetical protein LTR10_023591 [Elasticomyces elasticus]|uniref:Transcription factor domain-containing protein n=1 Tax=Exophiala sideris TaxID=1016849 RepID=A0ABR0JHP4_9EURO|nr:hypothetical protein LTR10_023591 [Elasticomyces elasticus]KAK5033390.1 hypothetical protein LTS07_003692 [Exophiala sideris]KAK5042115.1 hypothetical protein LTR13_001921 [Exophiala sideris]KAK5063934.1 hypothetical protein LTR69_003700 [Exophiala sideris]KAK5185383.1 hypothetical protein LTR44_002372 [Eurotiomycetes sp. CCFEE 6388]
MIQLPDTGDMKKLGAISARVRTDHTSVYISHLFSSFLHQHCFIGKDGNEHRDLKRLINSSSSLHNAALALGALDLEVYKRPKSAFVKSGTALKYYHEAVKSLQDDIAHSETSVRKDNARLWSTILLGIFELMYDSSGHAFLAHFMYGTSRLVWYQGAIKDRDLYLTIRVLELTRALVFWTDTFLVEPQWQISMAWMFDETAPHDWHPIDALFDLAVQFIALNQRAELVVRSEWPVTSKEVSKALHDAAADGMKLRSMMDQWHTLALMWSQSHIPKEGIDAPMQLALILYHTTSICLSNIFRSQHYVRLGLEVPRLSEEANLMHASRILDLVDIALSKTNLAGFLYCWPLQVASLRYGISIEQRERSLAMMKEIEKRGFVVSKPFEALMTQGWWKMDHGIPVIDT